MAGHHPFSDLREQLDATPDAATRRHRVALEQIRADSDESTERFDEHGDRPGAPHGLAGEHGHDVDE